MSADAHLDSCAITGAAQAGACHCDDDERQNQRKQTKPFSGVKQDGFQGRKRRVPSMFLVYG